MLYLIFSLDTFHVHYIWVENTFHAHYMTYEGTQRGKIEGSTVFLTFSNAERFKQSFELFCFVNVKTTQENKEEENYRKWCFL